MAEKAHPAGLRRVLGEASVANEALVPRPKAGRTSQILPNSILPYIIGSFLKNVFYQFWTIWYIGLDSDRRWHSKPN